MGEESYLPNLPLVGEEGCWDSIRDLISTHLIRRLEAVGDRLFQPATIPTHDKVRTIPISSEDWSRFRRDGTPQFVFLLFGRGLMEVEGKLVELRAGEGIYLPKGSGYTPYVALGDDFETRDWLWFKVHPFGMVTLRSRLAERAHYQSAYFIIAERRLTDLFWEWEKEWSRPDRDPRLTKSLLISLFGLLTRTQPFPPGNSGIVTNGQTELPLPVRTALTTLHRAYNKPLTLPQLASYCGVRPESLCRLFRRHLGVSPARYLRDLRLKVALYLVKETGLSIADVAFLSGFNDLRNFHRAFYQAFQKAPATLRRQKRSRSSRYLRVW